MPTTPGHHSTRFPETVSSTSVKLTSSWLSWHILIGDTWAALLVQYPSVKNSSTLFSVRQLHELRYSAKITDRCQKSLQGQVQSSALSLLDCRSSHSVLSDSWTIHPDGTGHSRLEPSHRLILAFLDLNNVHCCITDGSESAHRSRTSSNRFQAMPGYSASLTIPTTKYD